MHRFVASGFYAGLIPQRLWGSDNGAGTFGAAVAVVISLLLWRYPWWVGAVAFVIAFALSLWSAAPFADDHADPGWIVMDEVAGTGGDAAQTVGVAFRQLRPLFEAGDAGRARVGGGRGDQLQQTVGC